jgi:hypothetical protein
LFIRCLKLVLTILQPNISLPRALQLLLEEPIHDPGTVEVETTGQCQAVRRLAGIAPAKPPHPAAFVENIAIVPWLTLSGFQVARKPGRRNVLPIDPDQIPPDLVVKSKAVDIADAI